MTEHLPEPDLARFPTLRDDHLRILPAGSTIGRIYFADDGYGYLWHSFRHWGPGRSRFDPHPLPRGHYPDHSVMYGAPKEIGTDGPKRQDPFEVALLEVFRDDGIDTTQNTPEFVLFETARDLELLNLASSGWVTEAGGNQAISSGSREQSRKWARIIHDTYPGIDGVYYPCSHLPGAFSLALWARAENALQSSPVFRKPLADPSLAMRIDVIAKRYGIPVT